MRVIFLLNVSSTQYYFVIPGDLLLKLQNKEIDCQVVAEVGGAL